MKRIDRHLGVIAMAIAAWPCASAIAQTAPADTAVEAAKLVTDDIIVTARRRDEKLQDVPLAIVALSGAQLERANVTSADDLPRITPGLVFQPTALSSKALSLTLRSQRQNLPNITFDPSVVIYFSEIPNMRMIGASTALYDIASVQVLKGPQGTLFGRNSTGGAVLITPQAPSDEFGGYVKAGYGNYDAWEAEGAINVPLGERAALRVAVRHSQHDGYMPVVGKNYSVDDDNVDAYRVSLRLEPVDGLTNTTVFDGMHQTGSGTAYRLNYCNPAGLSKSMCSELDLLKGQKWNATTSNIDRNGTNIKAWQISNITTADLGDITLKNIFGYRDLNSFVSFDIDGTSKDILFATVKNNVHQVSNEVQLIGSAFDSALTYQLGGFFFEEEGSELQLTPTLGSTSASDLDAINRSYSLFGQATYKLPFLEGLSVTAGLRKTWDRRQMTNRGRNILGVYTGPDLSQTGSLVLTCRLQVGATAAAGVLNPCERTVKASFSKVTYNFSVDYKISRDVLVYAATRKGYRAGGFFNAPRAPLEFLPYQPELLTDYEIGLKSEYNLGAMRGRTNIAAYTGSFKGAQRNTTAQEQATDPTTGTSIFISRSIILNVQSARVSGVEIEQMLKPFDLLELNLSYAYSDAKYKKFIVYAPNGTTVLADYTKSPFAGAPKHSLTGSVRLQVPVDESAGRVFAQLSGHYLSKTVFADGNPSFNGTLVTDTDGTPPQSIRTRSILPGYHSLDARIDWEGAMGTRLDLSVWVRNLTDRHYNVGGQYVQALGFQVDNPATPRTYGMQARYTF